MNFINVLLILFSLFFIYMTFMIGIFSLFYKLPHSFMGMKKFILRLNNLEYKDEHNIIYQKSHLSCGASCIEMVLGYLKVKFNEDDLKPLYDMQGTSMLDLHNKCLEYRLKPQGLRFNYLKDFSDQLKSESVASIVSFDFKYIVPSTQMFFKPFYFIMNLILGSEKNAIRHWVVVKSIDSFWNFHILDPYIGEIVMSKDKFKKLWNNNALVISN